MSGKSLARFLDRSFSRCMSRVSSLAFVLVASLLMGTTAASAPITMGETSIFGGTDSGNGNLLVVQDATLPGDANILSLSFYVRNAAGDLRLGVYDATGPSGGPGNLVAETATFTPVSGWNTQPVITPVQVPAGNYWLAYFPSSSSLSFATDFSTGSFRASLLAFGPMPQTFPSTINYQGTTHWSLYATLNTVPSISEPMPPTETVATPLNGTGSVTLQWDPVSDPQVTQYEICYGVASGQYATPCIVANEQGPATNTKTITGLTAGKTYYFAARSANHLPGVYSALSNEVSTTVPAASLTTISVTPTNTTTQVGATLQFAATGTYSDGSTKNLTSQVTWTSSKTSVATISAGLASAVGAGTAAISAVMDGIAGSTTLTVQAPPAATLSSIALTPPTPTVQTGSTQQFVATGIYTDGSTKNLTSQATWTSSKTSVATISAGLASAVSAGTATISAAVDGIAGSTTLAVLAPPAPTLSLNRPDAARTDSPDRFHATVCRHGNLH